MLRFLIHLVGDIHQPLHNTSRVNQKYPEGDRGANSFVVDVPSQRNLHSYWDSCFKKYRNIKAPLNARNFKYIMQTSTNLRNEFPHEYFGTRLKVTSATKWSQEGKELAIDYAYHGIHEYDKPTREYTETGFEVIREQLTLAGYRLADKLVNILERHLVAEL